MTVSELLAASRAAHADYRRFAGRTTLGTRTEEPQLSKCGQAILAALQTRTEAEALDPQHADPAWLQDFDAMKGQPSASIIGFYVRYLASGAAVVC